MTRDTERTGAPAAPDWRRYLWPTWAQRRRMLVADAWIVALAAWLGLLLAYLLPSDLRSTNTPYLAAAWLAFMVRTFALHLGLVVLLAAVLAGALRRWRLLAVLVPPLVVMLGPEVWRYRPKAPPPTTGATFRVLSANLLASNRDTAGIVAEVLAADADVLVFQEYTSHWDAALRPRLAAAYPHVATSIREDSFGQGIYTRLPLVGEVAYALPLGTQGLPQCRVTLDVGGREVVLYNVHVFPPKNRAYWLEQRVALADLFRLLEQEGDAVVVCGDFNFTDRSSFGERMAALGFADAYDVAGWGRGTTWPNNGVLRLLPGVRIDHIYLGAALTARAAHVGRGRGSDHRPVTAELGFTGD